MIGLIAWMLYCSYEGAHEGIQFHQMDKDRELPFNIHFFFVLKRGAMLLFFVWLSGWNLELLIAAPFLYPLLHDGWMYWTRNVLNSRIYPKRFLSNPPESTHKHRARFSFNFITRVILAGIGIGIFILFRLR